METSRASGEWEGLCLAEDKPGTHRWSLEHGKGASGQMQWKAQADFEFIKGTSHWVGPDLSRGLGLLRGQTLSCWPGKPVTVSPRAAGTGNLPTTQGSRETDSPPWPSSLQMKTRPPDCSFGGPGRGLSSASLQFCPRQL